MSCKEQYGKFTAFFANYPTKLTGQKLIHIYLAINAGG